jgi:hypothetical protein
VERLRSNLILEPEFEARYPEAYKELFTPPFVGMESWLPEIGGLSLPSLGVRILHSAPESTVRGEGGKRPADAFSATSIADRDPRREVPPSQSPLQVPESYLRGILLAIMSREEFWEVALTPDPQGSSPGPVIKLGIGKEAV